MNERLRKFLHVITAAVAITTPAAAQSLQKPEGLEGPYAYDQGRGRRPLPYYTPVDKNNVPNFLDPHLNILTSQNMQTCLAEFDKTSKKSFDENVNSLKELVDKGLLDAESASRESGYWLKPKKMDTPYGGLICERMGDSCIWRVEEPYRVQIGDKTDRWSARQPAYAELGEAKTTISANPRGGIARFSYKDSTVEYDPNTDQFKVKDYPKVGQVDEAGQKDFFDRDISHRYTVQRPTPQQIDKLKGLARLGAELCPTGN